ncbi:hypothetical protein OCU_33650 [Mycobacterium intracellulare ATCC 13950]|uniref:Uncharacterized protein n=1 Tax=Mycobacterium intracellulare (strain ATCC 13950 / DSM 43223 / JCM 6384 / NCTC 13025 / 3600) TaxID=487521 RepID=H8IV14_MYCIA|nr:hypothetical protein OCU_33650 [Mycobacterium intracellulare ATCC 13950]
MKAEKSKEKLDRAISIIGLVNDRDHTSGVAAASVQGEYSSAAIVAEIGRDLVLGHGSFLPVGAGWGWQFWTCET